MTQCVQRETWHPLLAIASEGILRLTGAVAHQKQGEQRRGVGGGGHAGSSVSL